MTPSLFLHLMFYGVDSELKSLRQIAGRAESEHTLQLSKQALDGRFSSKSTAFVKELITEAISSQVTSTLAPNELQLFNRVRIKDSTTFGIHESLADEFEGYGKGGGRSSKAGVSIQFEFDIKSNQILDIDITSAVVHDAKDAVAKKDNIIKGDLIIRDLGYYSDAVIEQVVKKEAFLISRLYPNSIVWDDIEKGSRLDFEKLYHNMLATEIDRLDLHVFIGKNKRPLRLIVELMPDDVYQKRIRNRKKEIKTTGSCITDQFRFRSHFNLFVCNIPTEECSAQTISKLYRVRWQIELIFKIWKSTLQIDEFRKMKKDRFVTTLYLKLLWILINWKVMSDCRNYFYSETERLLSIAKSYQTALDLKHDIRQEFLSYDPNRIREMVIKLIDILSKNHWVEKRKRRQNFEEVITLLFCNLAS